MREIPKKNYIILVVLLAVTAFLTLFLSNIYKNKEKLTSNFYEYANKITPESFDEFMTENEDVIIYIGDKYDLTLETVEKELSEKIDKIEHQAFGGCIELSNIYCYAKEVPSTSPTSFDGSYPEYATLHIPASALEAYRTAVPWSSFGKIETLEIAVLEPKAIYSFLVIFFHFFNTSNNQLYYTYHKKINNQYIYYHIYTDLSTKIV